MNQIEEEHSIIRRYCDLTPLGIPNIPCIGVNRFVARHAPILHQHDGCVEILFNFSGVCEYMVRGVPYALRSSDVLVVPPNTEHSIVEYPKKLQTFALLVDFGRAPFPCLAPDEADWLRRQLLALPTCFPAGRCGLKERFLRVLNLAETGSGTTGGRVALRTAVLDLLMTLLAAAARPLRQPANQRLRELAERMERSPEADYPLSRLVRDYGLSANALIAQFRVLTGHTPHAYLLRCRVERAKCLLPDHTSAAVARMLGFPSPQHFATQFKRETGLTPRAWRQDHDVAIREVPRR